MVFDPSAIADAKKLTLSQDGTDVDANLTDFPVTVIPPVTWPGYSALAGSPPSYKKLSIDINGTQCQIEVSPNEWEDFVEPTNHYTMDDITGSTLTDEMGDTDGTISNMTQTATGALSDSQYYLAGGSCASVLRQISLGVSFKGVSLWFKRKVLTQYSTIASNASNYVINCAVSGSGTPYGIYISSGTTIYTDHVVSDTNWHHIFLKEGTTNNKVLIYLDGEADSTERTLNFAGTLTQLGGDIIHAVRETPDIDNIQIYDTTLTDAQIARLYAAQSQYYHPGRQAVLHTKIPSILAASGFSAVLSYDETADDNSTYVDVVGTTVAEGVYNSNYLANWTLAQDPSGSAPQLTDSTSNDNDGTATGTMTSADLVAGTIGMGIDFDGTDDSFTFSSNLGVTSYPFAYIARFEVDNLSTAQPLVSGDDASNYIGLTVWIDTSGAVNVRLGDGSGKTSADHYTWKTANSVISATTEYTLSLLVTNFATVVLYIDGAAETLSFSAGTGASADLTNASYRLGACAADSTFLDGKIYHSFFYGAAISANFAEIAHLCLTDAFLTWSAYSGAATNPYEIDLTIAAQSETLTDFPVTIPLQANSGLTNFDTSQVFNYFGPLAQAESPDVEPIAHYTMDNIVGSTLYDDKETYNGTITNMTPTAGGTFDNYLAGGDITSTIRNVDFGGSGISFKSVSFWVKRVGETPSAYYINGGSDHLVWLNGTTDYLAAFDGSTNADYNLQITDNTTWHHVVVVEGSNNNNHWVYLDGTKSSTEETTNLGGLFKYWGHSATLTSVNVDNVTNIQLFDTILTDAQVRNLYLVDKDRFATNNMLHPDTVLYIESNDTDGATEFFDLSDSAHAITRSGDTHHDTGASKYSKSAIYFDGTTDWLSVADSDDFTFSDGDFTLSTWAYFSTTGSHFPLIAQAPDDNNRWQFVYNGTGILQFYASIGGTAKASYNYTWTPSINTWYHLELVRSGTNLYLFINGSSKTWTTVATAISTNSITDISSVVSIGRCRLSTTHVYAQAGYIQGLQIIKGTALHTADFTPPICLPSAPDYRKLEFWNEAKTQKLYGEIELWETWDNTALRGLVHTKATLETSETVLKLNHNPANADNSAYVDMTTSSAAQSVWNSSHTIVIHPQDPSRTVYDSTNSEINATPVNMASTDFEDMSLGKGIRYNGTTQYLNLGDPSEVDMGANNFAIMARINIDDFSSPGTIVGKDTTSSARQFSITVDSTNPHLYGMFGNGATTAYGVTADNNTLGTDEVVVWFIRRGTDVELWQNDSLDKSASTAGSNSMGATSVSMRIGQRADGIVPNYFDGLIGEFRFMSTAPSSTWIATTNNTLIDNLITFSQASAGPLGPYYRLIYWDEPYGNLIGSNLQYWDESYALLNYIISYIDEVYGLQLGAYWNLDYGNNPVKRVFFDLLYGDNPILKKYWNLPYGDLKQLLKAWELKYNINKEILQHWEEKYSLTAKDVLAYFDQQYSIKDTNSLLKYFDEYYSVMSDSVVEQGTVTFEIDGVEYNDPVLASFELNKDSFYNTGELQFTDPVPYKAAKTGSVMRIHDTDIDLYLEVTIPTKSETTRETLYVIPAESKTRILENSNVINEEFGDTTAKTVCTLVAARYGITIDWQITMNGQELDWPLPADISKATDQTPYQYIQQITSEAGAILQTDFTGSVLKVMATMESNSNQWDTDSPSYSLEDNLHFFGTNQSAAKKPKYNKYRATDQAESDEINTYLEDEEYEDNKKIVKAFRVPWDDTLRTLYTSDNNATITGVGSRTLGVLEEVEDSVSIVNGEGENNLSKPFYGRISHSYNDNNLGTPTITEEGVVTTPVAGQSLLTIKYYTKYYKWIVADYDDEEIQIWVE